MKSLILLLLAFYLTVSQEFKGKVGIITGASTGIGFSTMQLLSRQGANIVFCARDSHPTWYNGKDAEDQINNDPIVQQNGGSATFVRADIRREAEVKAVITAAYKKFGKIDFAVNNAGIGGWAKRIDQLEEEDLLGEQDSIFNNLYGTLNCLRLETRWFMKYGEKNKTYSIVNLSSYNGLRACASCSLYSASKHGIIGLTKSAALEFADTNPKIRINAVAPGLTDTSLTRNQIKTQEYGINPWEGDFIAKDNALWLEKYKQWYVGNGTVGGRLAEPEEMASVVIFLLSDASSYVSGTVYSADNAYIAK